MYISKYICDNQEHKCKNSAAAFTPEYRVLSVMLDLVISICMNIYIT